jgi:hypothetical protein
VRKPLIEYLPVVLRDVDEYKVITATQEKQFDKVDIAITDIYNNISIDSSNEYGVARREKILGIVPKGTDTLDDRKFRIKTRESESLPYTKRTLYSMLENLCGVGGFTLTIDHANKYLTCTVSLPSASNYDDVRQLLERVVPANMIIDSGLMYNTHQKLSGFTHRQLSAYTHEQLRKAVL